MTRPVAGLAAVCLVAATLAPGMAAPAPAPPGAPALSPAPTTPPVRQRTRETQILRSDEGLEYAVHISAPVGPAPADGYPVLYVLDGDAWFGLAAETARLTELEAGPAIVVAVAYQVDTLYAPTRRGHDFTLGPPRGPIGAYAGTQFGGAEAFLTFLTGDVREAVAKAHPIDRRRQALFGHSLGGYFALHAAFTRRDAFSTIVAASPAIWWDADALLANEGRLAATGSDGPTLLLTAGGLEQQLGPADEQLLRRLYKANPAAYAGKSADEMIVDARAGMGRSRMIDNARDLAGRLRATGVPVDFQVLEGENHRSSVAPALNRALLLALRPAR